MTTMDRTRTPETRVIDRSQHAAAEQADVIAAIEPLFSRIAPALPPVQFTGTTGARYNMGAGQPDPASLPRRELAETVASLLASDDGPAALMYGDAAGFLGLREVLAEKLKHWDHIEVTPEEFLVVNGSNHGLAVVAQAFVNPGEVAIVESPTFMGGLRPLRQLQARIEMVPLDEHGMRVDALEERLRSLRAAGTPAKLVYTIPNFHNPAGVDLSLDRRQRLAELAGEFDFVILEDDAYGELRFSGESLPSIFSLAPRGRVVRSATLSKILAAGLRVGYLIGAQEVLARLNALKLDGGASPFTNRVAARWLTAHHDEHVRRLIDIYRRKRDALIAGLESGFAPGESLKPQWHVPDGGFFLWLKLPEGVDPTTVSRAAANRGVAYVPGPAFFADGSGQEYLRLAWSMLSEDDLRTAGRLVAEAIHEAA
ncbi:MAG: PLP-dependent aminotransferase family protein [Chloroflexi bacterium]|nr:PLP-dependent aminotransferase family protein [Chloroflexota bacterium]